MSTKKPKMTQAELRKFRSDVAKLKKAGLTRVDARKQKPTRHMKNQLKKYRDVLDGNATVVTVPSTKVARQYDGKFEHKYNKVVVPKTKDVRNTRYDKKVGDIISTRDYPGGVRLYSRYGKLSMEDMRKLDGKKNHYFTVYVKRGNDYEVHRRQRLTELEEIFSNNSWRNFADWTQYIVVEIGVRGKKKLKAEDVFEDDDI